VIEFILYCLSREYREAYRWHTAAIQAHADALESLVRAMRAE